jgi:hypothetical protein
MNPTMIPTDGASVAAVYFLAYAAIFVAAYALNAVRWWCETFQGKCWAVRHAILWLGGPVYSAED